MMVKGIGGHTKPNAGATDSWITPKNIIDALGPFDLDPCQCTPQPWPCAKNAYTIADDGLNKDWYGRVWLNPPYSNVWDWMEKLANHGNGIALIFARTETEGFGEFVWRRATSILFLKQRLFFHKPDGSRAKGNSGGPSCLVAYGVQNSMRIHRCGLLGAWMTEWDWGGDGRR